MYFNYFMIGFYICRKEDYISNSEIIVIIFKWRDCGQLLSSLDFSMFSKYPKCITLHNREKPQKIFSK